MSKGTILVTGGAGFIGSNFVILALSRGFRVVNLDKLTYAGNLENLVGIADSKDYSFVKGDIGDGHMVSQLLWEHDVNFVVNFAAESHVDRSIDAPSEFIETNIMGTFQLLEAAHRFFSKLREPIPTSEVLSGISSIMILRDDPVGMAGVMPIIFSFF